MRQLRLAAGLAAAFALVPGALAGAAVPACWVGPDSPGAMTVRGEEYRAGKLIQACEGQGMVSGGAVTLYHQNHLGQTVFDRLQDGETVDLGQTVAEADTNIFIQIVRAVLGSADQDHYGGKRLTDTDTLPGLPNGDILRPETALVFSAARAGLDRIDRLTVHARDTPAQPVFEGGGGARVAVPRDALQPGTAYRWEVRTDGKTYGGGFTMAAAADQADFEAELGEMGGAGAASPLAGHLQRAVLARQYGYTYDAQASVEAARAIMRKGEAAR